MTQSKEFSKIVLAVDGSDAAKKAAKKAFALAKETGLEITAIYVAQIPVTAVPTGQTPYMGDITTSMKEYGQNILDEITQLGSEYGVTIHTKILEGIPDDEIIKAAGKYDLIVMGSKGHSALERILIGSVSEKVLHHADTAVMIVR